MAQKLEELPIYPKVLQFCKAVSALLPRPAFGRNRKLADQIETANDSILSNLSEGFEQPTDKAVGSYLFVAKASAAEVLARLEAAQRKGWLTPAELAECKSLGEELQRILGGWIKYLTRCDWKDRGKHSRRSG